MQITGLANFHIDSDTSKAITIFDLQAGEIIVKPINEEILDNNPTNIFDRDISLSSFKGIIKAGNLFLSKFPNLFVKNYRRNLNQLDGISLGSFEFLEKDTSSILRLKLESSNIELNFQPFSKEKEFTELHFVNVNNTSRFNFDYNDKPGHVTFAKSGHAIIKIEGELLPPEIEEFKDIFKTTCCLANGRYSDIREVFTSNKLLLNLADYHYEKPPNKLVPDEEISELFNSVKKSFADFDPDHISWLKNATHYLDGGYRQTVDLEFRIVSLFTGLEILDKNSKLDKNIIHDKFNLSSLFDATLIIKVRNKLIHNGLSIQKSLSKALSENQENDKESSELISIFDDFPEKKHLAFYYYLLDLITENLMESYQYYGESISNVSKFNK